MDDTLWILAPGGLWLSRFSMYGLLQLGVFGFGLLIDGNVGVGVLPAHQEILIGRCGLGSVFRLRVSTAQLQICQCTDRIADCDPPMVENLLERCNRDKVRRCL